jgi:uncharacterized protein YkwD
MPRTPRRVLALISALAGLALAAPASANAAECANVDLVPDASNLAQVSQATLCLLNNERAARRLAPVSLADGLTRPSLAFSARMVAEGFFAHVSPDGGTLTDRLVAGGYIERDGAWTVGENIAWGQGPLSTPRSITAAWMNSPGHRANILAAGYDEIGIGVVLGTPGDTSWGVTYTTDFGDVAGDAAAATSAVKRARSARTAKTAKTARTARRCSRGRTAAARGAKAKGAKAKRLRSCAKAAGARRAR